MVAMDWRDRISVNPEVCHGKPCIKGTLIMVSIILDYLQSGEPWSEVLKQYPSLTEDDIRASMSYAAWLAREEEERPLHTEIGR